MIPTKTTAVAGMLVLAAALLLAMLLWREGPEPGSAPHEATGLPSNHLGELSSEQSGELEEGVSSAPERRSTDATFLPPWRLEGHVRDPEGREIPGTEIVFREFPGPWAAVTLTNKEGFYRFDLTTWPGASAVDIFGLSRAFLRAWAPGFKPLDRHTVRLPKGAAGAELVLVEDLELVPGGSISGTVRQPSGGVVDGVVVALHWKGSDSVSSRTDARGTFHLPVVEDGLHDLLAADGLHGVAFRSDLPLRADRDHTEDLRLVHKSELRGQIVYPNGEPIEGVRVSVLPPSRDDNDPYPTGAARGFFWTGPDGRFAFRGLRPGRYRIYMSQIEEGEISEFYLNNFFETDQPEQRIVLPLHRLTTEVTNELGRVVHGSRISWRGWKPSDGAYVQRIAAGAPLPDDVEIVHFGNGRVMDRFVPPGTWWLIRARAGDRDAWTIVEASPQRNETIVRLELRRSDLSSGVRVTATDVEGMPIPGIMVTLDSTVPGMRYSERIEDGSTVLVNAPPGPYHMWVYGIPESEYLWEDLHVHLVAGQQEEIEVAVVKGGRLQWTVHAPGLTEEDQIRGLEIHVEGPMDRVLAQFAQPNERGGYSSLRPHAGQAFTHGSLLRPGRYDVTVQLEGYRPFRTAAVVRPGGSTPVEVFLER